MCASECAIVCLDLMCPYRLMERDQYFVWFSHCVRVYVCVRVHVFFMCLCAMAGIAFIGNKCRERAHNDFICVNYDQQ